MALNIFARYPARTPLKPWEDLPIQELISLAADAGRTLSRGGRTEAAYGTGPIPASKQRNDTVCGAEDTSLRVVATLAP
jgi:hypothetical protein